MTTPPAHDRLQALTTGHAAALFHELHDPARRAPTYLATDVHLEDRPSRTKCTLDPDYQTACTCPEATRVYGKSLGGGRHGRHDGRARILEPARPHTA